MRWIMSVAIILAAMIVTQSVNAEAEEIRGPIPIQAEVDTKVPQPVIEGCSVRGCQRNVCRVRCRGVVVRKTVNVGGVVVRKTVNVVRNVGCRVRNVARVCWRPFKRCRR